MLTCCTAITCEPTDIPEDFTIGSSDGTITSICLTIPAGAAYLFVNPNDSFFNDNVDPNADYQVRITDLGCVADVTPRGGNGTVDIDDLVAVITHWGQAGVGDVSPLCGNGVVNIDDLVTIITSWGPCP